MMQTQRTILWVIFAMSLLFLWDNWQRYNGKASMFGGQAKTEQSAKPPAAGGSTPAAPAGSAAVPNAPAAAASGAQVPGAVAAAPASVAASGELVRLSNDVLQLDIDTVGGQIRRAELSKHIQDPTDRNSGNLVILQNDPGKIYLAQSGLVGANGMPNHTSPMTVVRRPQGGSGPQAQRTVPSP